MDSHSALLGTSAGRWLVGAILVVGGFWIVGPNMPAGPVRDDIDALWEPAIQIGLVQDWTVFSPDPRSQSVDLYAEIVHDDGSTERWDVPDFGPVIGAYRQYRWNKWQERVRLDVRSDLWEPTAVWIAREHRRDGALPASVTIVRRWIDHEPLSELGAIDLGWNEFAFYEWRRSP